MAVLSCSLAARFAPGGALKGRASGRGRPGLGEFGGSSARPAQVPADGIAVGVVLALADELFQRACLATLGKPFKYMIPDAADLEQVVSSGPAELRGRVPGEGEAS